MPSLKFTVYALAPTLTKLPLRHWQILASYALPRLPSPKVPRTHTSQSQRFRQAQTDHFAVNQLKWDDLLQLLLPYSKLEDTSVASSTE